MCKLIILYIMQALLTPQEIETEIAPAFKSQEMLSAIDLIKDKKFEDAYKMISNVAKAKVQPEEPERVRFLLGFLSFKTERYLETEVILDGLDTQVPLLFDRIHFMRGFALYKLGRMEDALKEMSLVPVSSSMAKESMKIRAKIFLSLTRYEEANEVYKRLYNDGNRDAEVVTGYAMTLELIGKRDEAINILKKAFFENIFSRNAFLKSLEKMNVKIEPTQEETLTYARALLDAHKSEEVLKVIEPLLKSQEMAIKCNAHLVKGSALTKLRQHKEALSAFREALSEKACEKHIDIPKTLFSAARAAYRSSNFSEGDKYAVRLESEFPSSSLNDDLAIMRARLALSKHEYKKAERILLASTDKWPDGDMVLETYWLIIWGRIVGKDYKKAIAKLKEGIEKATQARDQEYLSRFLYWSGRVSEFLQKKKDAIQMYKRCIKESPMSYYSFLALNRFAKAKNTNLHSAFTEVIGSFDNNQLNLLQGNERALWLAKTGLYQMAAEEVMSSNDENLGWIAVFLLDRAGFFEKSHRLASSLLKNRFWPDQKTKRLYELAYPRPFSDLVEKEAKTAKVEDALVYAIMREESAFIHNVESRANAIGLMQLILPTAKIVGKRFSMNVTEKELKDPAINIKLGVSFIAELLTRFKKPLLAIPAYNAGGKAIADFLAKNPKMEIDTFVESISAKETRDYARRVFESYAIYRYLYNKGKDRFTEVAF